jgi:16S rRNA G966 N2-methylase RsmD
MKRRSEGTGALFIEPSGQLRLVDKSAEQQALERAKVECLGMTFDSEDSRRAYFIERLREKLADPEFRSTPGFPVATDKAILEISDPPYYTACPNPFIAKIMDGARNGPSPREEYTRLPYSLDLIEKRTDEIYTAHTYHTKVPPKAIARLILHYTEPGDIVLDVFAGSGMTGVAAVMCADPQIARELGGGKAGPRVPVLLDLSPAATFIASNYLAPPSPDEFELCARSILRSADQEIAPLWQLSGEGSGTVDFCVWVESFACPHCQKEILSERVLDATDNIGSAKDFNCPHCNGLVSKAPTSDSYAVRLVRQRDTYFDRVLNRPVARVRRVPIAAQVRLNGGSKRLELNLDQRKHLQTEVSARDWFPTAPLVEGERYVVKDCLSAYGITHIHHFYLPRQLATMACLWRLAGGADTYEQRCGLRFWISSNSLTLTVLNRFAPTHHSQVNRYFSGTLYIPSTVAESSYRYTFENKIKRLSRAFASIRRLGKQRYALGTQSATSLSEIPDNAVDYVFIDPPFGRNLQYSELNQIWEAWLQVQTNRDFEAVIDSTRHVDVPEYAQLMHSAFRELARVLKPARWITVEFHNSSVPSGVWLELKVA